MRLLVLRHGAASYDAASDAERPLTDNGRSQTVEIAERCRKELADVTAICTSPLLRARQTADICRAFANRQAGLFIHECLTPESSPESVTDFLQTMDDTCILLVSHMPLASELVGWFTDRFPGPSFPTSGLACLDLFAVGRGCGELQWFMAPEWPGRSN